jgi:hypothetical protein
VFTSQQEDQVESGDPKRTCRQDTRTSFILPAESGC